MKLKGKAQSNSKLYYSRLVGVAPPIATTPPIETFTPPYLPPAVHLINRTPTSALNGFTPDPEGVWIGHPLTRLRLYDSSLWLYCLQTYT